MAFRLIAAFLAFLTLSQLGGCGGYALQGQVVRGPYSMLAFVSPDDDRLDDPGVGNVQVSVYRDPDKLNAQLAARAVSTPDGRFTIPIDHFGAGWLEEQWRITARRPQYSTAQDLITLPRSPSQYVLLVMLAPGQTDQQRDDEDLMDVYREYR